MSAPIHNNPSDESADPGRQPRKADQLRGMISNLANANEDRHAVADQDRAKTRRQMKVDRTLRAICAAITRQAAITDISELHRLSLRRRPPDFTPKDLEELIATKQDLTCKACQYNLFGLPPHGTCPECGVRYQTGSIDWEVLRTIIARELGVDPESIQPNTHIVASIRD